MMDLDVIPQIAEEFWILFRIPIKGKKVGSFSDIQDEVKDCASNQRSMLIQIVQPCKLLYINPATASTGDK